MSNNKDNNGNKNGFTGAVRSMFDGIDHVVSSKTVVGDPIYVDGMTLIPLMEETGYDHEDHGSCTGYL